MPYDGASGTFTLSDTIAPATLADANELQAILNDIQTALTAAFCKDGESTLSAGIKGFDGTVSLPGYSFSGDLDSGLYRIGANNIGLTLGGSKVVDYATTGVSVTGTLGGSGNFAIATSKFTVAAASGNTVIAGTAAITGDVAVNTNKFTVTASSGNTAVAGTLAVTGAATLSSTASVASTLTASSGFTVGAGAISVPAGSITGLALTDGTVTAAKLASAINAASAVGRFTLAVTAPAITVSSVDTATERVTFSGLHGCSTGDLVALTGGTIPTGLTSGAIYYVNAISTSILKFYTALSDATNDTNPVNLTGAGTGSAPTRFALSVSANAGLATNPLQFTCAQTAIAGTITLSSAASTANWLPILSGFQSATADNVMFFGYSSITSTVLTWGAVNQAGTVQAWTGAGSPFTAGRSYYIAFQAYNG